MKNLFCHLIIVLLLLGFGSCSDNNNIEIDIKSPSDKLALSAGEQVKVEFAVSDDVGISSIAVEQNDLDIDTIVTYLNTDKVRSANFNTTWNLPSQVESGASYEFKISASSLDGGGDELIRKVVVD